MSYLETVQEQETTLNVKTILGAVDLSPRSERWVRAEGKQWVVLRNHR